MLISVILPVFNAEKYLSRCIESVLGQTHGDLEVILVDDGSTDGSGAICDSFSARDARVRTIHKQNEGVSAARNDGLEAAKGEFVAFCDNDDHMAPGMLERLLEICIGTGAEIAHCRRERSAAERLQTPPKQPVEVVASRELLERFYSDATIYVWDKLYRRELFEGCGWQGKGMAEDRTPIRFPVGSCSAEDSAVAHRLIAAAKTVAITKERLYCHFVNPNSVMQSGFDTRWATWVFAALDDRLELARRESLPRLAAETLARRVYEAEYQIVMNRRSARDKKFAREMKSLKRRYYREAMTEKSVKLIAKSQIFVVLCRYLPIVYHLYNHLKWPEIAFGEAK